MYSNSMVCVFPFQNKQIEFLLICEWDFNQMKHKKQESDAKNVASFSLEICIDAIFANHLYWKDKFGSKVHSFKHRHIFISSEGGKEEKIIFPPKILIFASEISNSGKTRNLSTSSPFLSRGRGNESCFCCSFGFGFGRRCQKTLKSRTSGSAQTEIPSFFAFSRFLSLRFFLLSFSRKRWKHW